MKTFDIKEGVLNYKEDDGDWTPYTVEDLSKIVTEKVLSQQIINDRYLESVKEMIQPLLDLGKPEDKRYEVAKTILSSSLPDFKLKRDYYGQFSNLSSKLVEHVVKQAYLIADEFIKQGFLEGHIKYKLRKSNLPWIYLNVEMTHGVRISI